MSESVREAIAHVACLDAADIAGEHDEVTAVLADTRPVRKGQRAIFLFLDDRAVLDQPYAGQSACETACRGLHAADADVFAVSAVVASYSVPIAVH